ncbi:hypothetical protein FB45DRAFT_806400 [Roridomyces roridus]|uniref:DUF6535 domain-containing protein n=1 Tax=Roridomyces roridus TaxID=1738132 RepID=A0AAD7F861_9AGAR|nr:hypothetical protein FB45DRAFT_806400 [Roridomyces roridus]
MFWNSYKMVADEYDREHQVKYSTDLDTSLIFAGLFSAVSSAFIIAIQPELQGQTPLNHDTQTAILIAQCLLYVSLSTTLLAALLAVLGKQWLLFYSFLGEKGTLEARGLERQRKLDGLRRWKFNMAMQTFPLLLQVALFLFLAALSIYLWTVHHALAIIVVSFTGAGLIFYCMFLTSAVISPDSPFQTPLAPAFRYMVQNLIWVLTTIVCLHSPVNFLCNPECSIYHANQTNFMATASNVCFSRAKSTGHYWHAKYSCTPRPVPHNFYRGLSCIMDA